MEISDIINLKKSPFTQGFGQQSSISWVNHDHTWSASICTLVTDLFTNLIKLGATNLFETETCIINIMRRLIKQ